MTNTLRLLTVAIAVAALAGCAKRQTVEPTDPSTPPARTTETPATASGDPFADPNALNTIPCLQQRVVYFDFDRADVRGEFDEILGCHGKYLSLHPSARVSLEGHADERGSREYNLGLGERRAGAVRDYIAARGATGAQLSNVSYGEERPTCTTSDESCWGQNRRVEIVYTAK